MALDARMKTIGAQIEASGTGPAGQFGIGPVIAGRILAEVGDAGTNTTLGRPRERIEALLGVTGHDWHQRVPRW